MTTERTWVKFDAGSEPLGRIVTEIARRLQGKHQPTYTPHIDSGDHVVVVNAEKLFLTGRKAEQKTYYRHSWYPGGLTETPFADLKEDRPEEVVRKAVYGMLPNNKQRNERMKRLHVYQGEEHPHKNVTVEDVK